MFLHLGGDVVVPKEEVIAIFGTHQTKKSEINREFMEMAQNDGFISPITDRATAKSVVITTKKIYLSPISSITLKKRSDEIIENMDSVDFKKPW